MGLCELIKKGAKLQDVSSITTDNTKKAGKLWVCGGTGFNDNWEGMPGASAGGGRVLGVWSVAKFYGNDYKLAENCAIALVVATDDTSTPICYGGGRYNGLNYSYGLNFNA